MPPTTATSSWSPTRRTWSRLAVVVFASSTFVALARPADGQAVRNLAAFRSSTLQGNDDGSTGLDGGAGAVNFGFGTSLNFFGASYSSAYVNNNGNITFAAPLREFTPFGLTTTLGTPIIAPFFADVDTRGTTGAGGDGGGNAGNVPQAFGGSGLVTYGVGSVAGRTAFGVNWFSDCTSWTGAGTGPSCADFASTGGLVGVGYFNNGVNRRNIFQLILIDRTDTGAGNFDIEFNYNQLQWEAGSASGGTGGLGGQSARVGYSNGTGVAGSFQELGGSGVNGAFLDGGPAGTSLVRNSRNSAVLGRYLFEVRGGAVQPPQQVVPEPSTWAMLGAGLTALTGIGVRRRRANPAV